MQHDWLEEALRLADASWQPVLRKGVAAVAAADPDYLERLAHDTYLPTRGRLFAAFAQPLDAVRYVLVGEGPYPREESATGVCFMDGAVGALWSFTGLSKQVNRATSLRNFMKMLMVADGLLAPDVTTGEAVADVAQRVLATDAHFIHTLPELQNNLHANGFLLLNAALVFRPHVPPVKEAKAWQPFLEVVLDALASLAGQPAPTLVLWGKIAALLQAMAVAERFPQAVAEHPYNLSFIKNKDMQQLFGPMQLLARR
ncbi:MAG: uracil-DNA glycosylase [Betaproteobacteria bacterium]|nr:uracil-DNA glycosylase [Betaproteobacteria bacterium]